jgi:hypothetical protein
LLLKVGFDILQPPRLVNRGVPRVLSDICIKALEQKPGERYPTPAALADDLRAFQEGKLRTPSLWQRLVGFIRKALGRRQV